MSDSNFKYTIILILLFAWFHFESRAQSVFTENHQIDPENNGNLSLSIDNLSFFRNLETDGDIWDGYTLPGFRFAPRAILYPASIIKLEAGLSLLKFWGAEKYPCYTYQDIAKWKADNYQYGFHLLPFFRAQIQPVKQVSIVLGNIYGGSNHQLIEPLYNPELNLSADPECGAQFIYKSKIARIDVWTSWDSFIFENDTHKEGLTFGTSATLNITPESSFFHLSLPMQFLSVHRGGEIDTTTIRPTTMNNAAAGLKFQFNTGRLLKYISFQMMGTSYNCSLNDEPVFTDGWGLYSNLTAKIWNIELKTAWWRSRDYINIFGNPVFGNVSLTIDGRIFPKTDVFNGGISYEQQFGNGFYLGVDTDFYYNPELTAYDKGSYDAPFASKISKSFNYSFGIYLRINPSIILKKKIFQ